MKRKSDTTCNPREVTTTFISQVFGITARQVQRLAEDGVMVRAGHGKYDLTASIQNYFRPADDSDLNAERVKNLRLDNERRSLELDKEYGEVHGRVDYEIALETTMAGVARTLEALPANVARQVPNLPQAALDAVDDCAAQCQNRIADLLENAGREPEAESIH